MNRQQRRVLANLAYAMAKQKAIAPKLSPHACRVNHWSLFVGSKGLTNSKINRKPKTLKVKSKRQNITTTNAKNIDAKLHQLAGSIHQADN